MDELIDALKRLIKDLDNLAATDCGHAGSEESEYCKGRTAAYWLSAEWVRAIIELYTNETL